MKVLIVSEKYDNKKLINCLQDNFKCLSSATIYKTLRKKDIKLNDKRISDNCLLKAGDELKIYIADDILEPQIEVPVVYEDENIVVFNKPTNLEVTGDGSLSEYAKKKYNSFIEPCHRLDRNTSGLVLFAKNADSLSVLVDAFKEHLIEKHYVAVVCGIPKETTKTLTAYLFKDAKKALVYISDKPLPKYQKIITHYSLLQSNPKKNISLLDVKLETGKTHQIRAHLAHIGHPIVGDGKYGINEINKKYGQKTQLLSSYSLSFKLPNTSALCYLNGLTIKQSSIPFKSML